jgi:hypothetical protein
VSLVEHELLTLPEPLSSPLVFSGVTRSLVLYVCFVDRCLYFCTFSFGHCVVCSYSIYGFWLPPFGILDIRILITSLWYLQTLLMLQRGVNIMANQVRRKSDVWKLNVPEIPPLCFFLFTVVVSQGITIIRNKPLCIEYNYLIFGRTKWGEY